MITEPTIKLVTPTYNQCDFLLQTIESVMNQSYSDIEYVVVDDGSTDNTSTVLAGLRDVITVKSQENMGQVRTLNREWMDSESKYLSYLSSDDLLDRNAIEECISYLEKHPECVCVFPDSNLINHKGRIIKENVAQAFDLEKTIVEQECYIGPGAVFRNESFLSVGPWDPELKLAPDRDFWIRLAEIGEICFLKKPLASYRMHRQSTSTVVFNRSEKVSLEYVKVLDKVFANRNPLKAHLEKKSYQCAYLLVTRNCILSANWSGVLRNFSRSISYGISLVSLKKMASLCRVVVGRVYWKIRTDI